MSVRVPIAFVMLCVAVYAVVGAAVARRQSATVDEVAHLAAGVGYLQGDMRLNREHPPLVKWLAALALGLEEAPAIPDHVDAQTQWSFGHAILHSGPPGEALARVGRARMPVVFLAALCPLLVALLAWRIAGPVASVAAALVAACSPLWYAHGTLVTTDAAVSVFTLATALCAVVLLRDSEALGVSWRLWVAGLVLATALGAASKYSMLVSIVGVGCAATLAASVLRRWRALLVVVAALAVGTLLGVVLSWGWPPDVAAYVEGVRSVGFNHQPGYPFYAFGEIFHGAGTEPLYFVRALLVKVEWPVLLLSVTGLALLLSSASRPGVDRTQARADLLVLTIVPLVYLVTMSLRAPALGVRYVLPVVPFLFVLAGVAVQQLWASMAGRALLMLALVLEITALTGALHASPIAWFNGFPCRTGQIPSCLDDSNVDWGQSLPALGRFRDAHFAGVPLRVMSLTRAPLHAYLENAVDIAPRELVTPYRALYAVSLHTLARMPDSLPFAHVAPVAVIEGSYGLFDLRAVDVLPTVPVR